MSKPIADYLSPNVYPGRGIALGMSQDGQYAVAAYFIMGRSENSRNRIFVETDDGIRTQAFDEAKVEDPRLIIYTPARLHDDTFIITNGDQTDTIYDALQAGATFQAALQTREYEPDAPNYTPRISGAIDFSGALPMFRLSILKKDAASLACERFYYTYDSFIPGEGRIVHTYSGDGNPLPAFSGEPAGISLPGDIDALTQAVWAGLNADNRVSLYVCFRNIQTGARETRIINKHA